MKLFKSHPATLTALFFIIILNGIFHDAYGEGNNNIKNLEENFNTYASKAKLNPQQRDVLIYYIQSGGNPNWDMLIEETGIETVEDAFDVYADALIKLDAQVPKSNKRYLIEEYLKYRGMFNGQKNNNTGIYILK